jgi:heptosyltransferase-2
MKIAVLLPNWVGDLAMATPAIRALRGNFPEATLVGIAKPYLLDLLNGSPWFDTLIPAEHQRWLGPRGFWQTVAALRSLKLETVVSLRGTLRGALMSYASGAKTRVGYGQQSFSRAYTHRYLPTLDAAGKQAESAVDIYLQTAGLLGSETSNTQLELTATPNDEALTERVWRRLQLPSAQNVVMFNAGAAQGAAKLWPLEKFAQLAQQCVDTWGVHVLVNCGPKEKEQAKEIVQLANRPRVVSLADEEQLPFGLLKGLLRRVRLLVTTDSGPRHLAAAVGTPTVAIFGPVDPRICHNYNPCEEVVRLNLDCMPCGKYSCPLGHRRCMVDLGVEQVFAAAQRLWERSSIKRSA